MFKNKMEEIGAVALLIHSAPMAAMEINANLDKCLSRACNVAERAFGMLKAHWRCLTSQIPMAEENITAVITACLVLHNICESKGHTVLMQIEDPPSIIINSRVDAIVDSDRIHRQMVHDVIADYLMLGHG